MNCKNCIFVKETMRNGNLIRGYCYRYPIRATINDIEEHWCGDFVDANGKEVKLTNVDESNPVTESKPVHTKPGRAGNK